jgi:hypothetical protein
VPGFNAVRLRAARWLFMRFLEKDMASLNEMRFHAPTTHLAVEEPLERFFSYLENLPSAPGRFGEKE